MSTPAWPMMRTLVGVGSLCGLAIVSVYQLTEPIILKNRIEARNEAILEVLPGAASTAAFLWNGQGFDSASPESQERGLVFAGYTADGSLAGVAVEGAGMGYQDVVRVLYGLDVDQQAIVGMRVLESRETPGLGTRVETDPAFLANFVALDVSLDGGAVAHPIQAVKAGTKTEPWQVDCISGATITSEAVADILRESSELWVPRVVASVEELEQ